MSVRWQYSFRARRAREGILIQPPCTFLHINILAPSSPLHSRIRRGFKGSDWDKRWVEMSQLNSNRKCQQCDCNRVAPAPGSCLARVLRVPPWKGVGNICLKGHAHHHPKLTCGAIWWWWRWFLDNRIMHRKQVECTCRPYLCECKRRTSTNRGPTLSWFKSIYATFDWWLSLCRMRALLSSAAACHLGTRIFWGYESNTNKSVVGDVLCHIWCFWCEVVENAIKLI